METYEKLRPGECRASRPTSKVVGDIVLLSVADMHCRCLTRRAGYLGSMPHIIDLSARSRPSWGWHATGFTVACFPLEVVGGSAGPTRAVAILDG